MYITLINLWVLYCTRESKIRAQIPPTIVYKTLEVNYTCQKTFYTKHHHAFANSNLSSAPSLASSVSFADISPFVSHSSGQIFTSKSLGLILPSSAARSGSATAGSSMTDFNWPPAIYGVFAVAWLNKGNFRIAVSMDGTQKPWGYDEMMSLKQRQRYMLKNIKLSSAIKLWWFARERRRLLNLDKFCSQTAQGQKGGMPHVTLNLLGLKLKAPQIIAPVLLFYFVFLFYRLSGEVL